MNLTKKTKQIGRVIREVIGKDKGKKRKKRKKRKRQKTFIFFFMISQDL